MFATQSNMNNQTICKNNTQDTTFASCEAKTSQEFLKTSTFDNNTSNDTQNTMTKTHQISELFATENGRMED